MSRSEVPYTKRRAPQTFTPTGRDADEPVAGYYRTRLARGAHPVGVRIWFGPPHDPVTGEEMDRGWRWQAAVHGRDIPLARVWPSCGREPITQAEHDHLAHLQRWGIANAPNSPQANPDRAVNFVTAPMPW